MDGFLFGPQAVQQIRDTVRRVQTERGNGKPGAAEPFTKFGPHLIRIGRTGTNAEFPTYPTSDANTFLVKFGWGEFTETPGEQALTFTPYAEPFERVCRDLGGRYWPENSLVACVLLRGKWFIIGASGVNLIRFKMTTQMALGGTGTAIEIGSGPTYTETGDPFPIKDPWDDPGSWREDVHSARRSVPGGYRGWCILPTDAQETGGSEAYREIIWMEQLAESIEFTLITDMSGGSAEATVNDFYQGKDPDDVWPVSEGVKTYVYDPQGNFPRALAGCKGSARYDNREHKYIVVSCDQQVLLMRATLSANMCSGDNAALSGHARITWPPYGKMPAVAPTTATNPLGLQGISGDTLTILYNDSAGEWQVENVEHHVQEITKDIAYSSCGITRYYFNAAIQICAADVLSDTAVTLYSHDLVTNVEKTTTQDTGGNLTTCKVVQTKKPFCLFDAAPTPATSDVFAATKMDGVVTNVFEDIDGCVKQTKQEVWVVCASVSDVDSDVFCTTDECP